MEERGISRLKLGCVLNLREHAISSLLEGSFLIDNDMACKLSEVLGSSPDFWENRERNYRRELRECLNDEHDTIIAAQATEAENKRVLDAVLKCFDAAEFYCYPHPKVDIGTSGCAKFVRCGNILPMIESLRLEPPEPKERETK
jgi:plasmid maintenance system antidote protein VapI